MPCHAVPFLSIHAWHTLSQWWGRDGPCLMNMHVVRISFEFGAIWCTTNVFWLIRNIIRNMQFCVIHYLASVRNLSASVECDGSGAESGSRDIKISRILAGWSISIHCIWSHWQLNFECMYCFVVLLYGCSGVFISRAYHSFCIYEYVYSLLLPVIALILKNPLCFCSLFLCTYTKYSISIGKWKKSISSSSTISAANHITK